jgi:mxaJ protein
LAALSTPVAIAPPQPLRVCSDPNNLPFSNQAGEGFEDAIARELARFTRSRLEMTWWAQRRGFIRHTLDGGVCDVVIGFPAGADRVLTTIPYYRSTYVFVTARARHLSIHSYDDPVLRRLRIGVPLVGDDGASAPPGLALSRRGIVANVVGYSVYGEYATDNPASTIVSAVARGAIDVAAVWGPPAGYFAQRRKGLLDLVPVSPPSDGGMPQTFAISMAVRSGDRARLEVLNEFLRQKRREVDAILARYHVPRVPV